MSGKESKKENNKQEGKDKSNQKDKKGSNKKDSKTKQDKTTEPTKEDSKSKHIGMGLLVGLILILIGYTIYCWQAYINGWFPFADFVPNPPVESFCPTCTDPTYDATKKYPSYLARLQAAGFIENDVDRVEEANANIGDILSNNCYWYCNGKITDGVNNDLVTNINMSKVGTPLTAPISGEVLPLSVQESIYPGVKRQQIAKPSDDSAGKYACDCDSGYYKDPIRVVDT